jgi:hypothetical protein
MDDPLGDPAIAHDLAGEDEERNGEQGKAVCAVDDRLGHELRLKIVDREKQGNGYENQRMGDRHADREKTEQRREKQKNQGNTFHRATPS